jgi:predicted DNA-binding transcriptional regulator
MTIERRVFDLLAAHGEDMRITDIMSALPFYVDRSVTKAVSRLIIRGLVARGIGWGRYRVIPGAIYQDRRGGARPNSGPRKRDSIAA